MQNGQAINSGFECPVHGVEHNREYTFGMSDSYVNTFPCGCATSYESGRGTTRYWTSYKQAAACARGEVARMDVLGNYFKRK